MKLAELFEDYIDLDETCAGSVATAVGGLGAGDPAASIYYQQPTKKPKKKKKKDKANEDSMLIIRRPGYFEGQEITGQMLCEEVERLDEIAGIVLRGLIGVASNLGGKILRLAIGSNGKALLAKAPEIAGIAAKKTPQVARLLKTPQGREKIAQIAKRKGGAAAQAVKDTMDAKYINVAAAKAAQGGAGAKAKALVSTAGKAASRDWMLTKTGARLLGGAYMLGAFDDSPAGKALDKATPEKRSDAMAYLLQKNGITGNKQEAVLSRLSDNGYFNGGSQANYMLFNMMRSMK